MKNTLLICILIITCASACNKSNLGWAEYNDAVVLQVKAADSTIKELFTFKDFETFPETKNNYITVLENVKSNLQNITSPGNDDSLRLIALELTDVYLEITTNDFNGIYVFMHDNIYTPDDSMSVDSLSDIMYAKWQIVSENFASAQLEFSRKHDVVLELSGY